MPQHYHHGLVALSLAVAILASYAALTLAIRIRLTSGWATRGWLLGGGFAMGLGIWAMHFVGMLALSLPVPITYDLPITLLSLVVVVAVSTFALSMASKPTASRSALLVAGVAMGIGICAMHYIGMAAIRIRPGISYEPSWVAVSMLIAIAASLAAIWIVFTTRPDGRWSRRRRVAGAIGMGLAIAGMHYAGMAAARFPAAATTDTSGVIDRQWLAAVVATVSVLVLVGSLLLSYLEARAARHSARMQASLAEEQESGRAKDAFLAMLGHELRNPLASISNAIYLLDRVDPSSPNARFAREIIARQTGHLSRIVDDLLDVGRAVAGKMSFSMQPMELGSAVESAVAALRTAGILKDRQVDCRCARSWINGDRTRIEQVVANLLRNAVQHTGAGGSITIRVVEEDRQAKLVVADDGEGMDVATRNQAFDLFYQAHQALDRGRGGLGIGLTLVRRIVDMHGGEVGLESAGLGRGTTCTVRLPSVAAPASVAGPATPVAAKVAKRRIVLIDDEMDGLLSLRHILEGDGHNVRTAAEGGAGLEAIMEWTPDVAVVDIGLPGLDGYQIARQVRASGGSTYLVALSGYGQVEDKEKARNAGFDEHLTKPADPDQLLELVSRATRRVAGVAG